LDPTLPLLEGSRRPHPTTNNNRLLSAVESLIVMRSLRGAKRCVGLGGQMHRRAQWPGYRPARSGLSTPIVKKLSYRSQEFCDAKKSLCFGALAALEPHSCDVLTTRYALNRRAPAGADAAYFTYRDRRSINPSPSLYGQETLRDLLTIDVRDSGRSSFSGL
jgi:hypothetical protein